MLSITDLKNGTKIDLEGAPYVVLKYEHHKMGRGGAVVKTTMRNLITGNILTKTFQGSDKIDPADIANHRSQFTYSDKDIYYFMDEESYEQFEFSRETLGDTVYFLKDGMTVDVMYFNGTPINVMVKPKVELEVVDTPPGVKGDTVSGGSKPAILETGLTIQVPLFIKNGDVIRINTEEQTYVERV